MALTSFLIVEVIAGTARDDFVPLGDFIHECVLGFLDTHWATVIVPKYAPEFPIAPIHQRTSNIQAKVMDHAPRSRFALPFLGLLRQMLSCARTSPAGWEA